MGHRMLAMPYNAMNACMMILPAISRLPDLSTYRQELCTEGAKLPLPLASWTPDGMLSGLPPAPSDRQGWPWTLQTPPFAREASDWPRISLVTPSFRQAAYLEETLRSVLLQNYPRLEYIVLDADSRDGSEEILSRYRDHLSYQRVGPDRGQSHAINRGFSLAQGEIFGWLNSDDMLAPGALRRVAESFRSHRADLVYGDAVELLEDEGTLRYLPARWVRASIRKQGGLLYQPSTFWRANRHLPLNEDLHCALDYDLWVRMLPAARLRRLPGVLSIARVHSEAKTYSAAQKASWERDSALNGANYPGLYAPTPLRDRLERVLGRLVERLRRRRERELLAQVYGYMPGLRAR